MTNINFEKFKNMAGKDLYSEIFGEIGDQNENVVMLGPDAIKSNGGGKFIEKFPERTFDFGIAEPNMVGAGAGLAKMGKIPMVGMFGFLVLRTAEMIRDDVCYQNSNVKLFGSHSGISMAAGGVTHHGINDISVLRSFPNITIIQPGSPREAVAALTTAILDHVGPVYLRIPNELYEGLYDDSYKFEIGKAYTLQDGKDITIIASGVTIAIAKEAASQLASEGISVRLINTPTIKPMDKDAIIKAAKETKGIITVEDNEIACGLGAEICQIVSENYPVKVKMFGFPKDRFTVIGPSPKSIFDYFGINAEGIRKAAKKILS